MSSDSTCDLQLSVPASNAGNPSGDVLRFDVVKDADENPWQLKQSTLSNKYAYVQFANTSYTIQAGDILEYDVKLDNNNAQYKQEAGVDLAFTDGTWLRSTNLNPPATEVVDQNGYTAHPGEKIDYFDGGQWYHRAIVLTPLAGKTIQSWVLADEGDEQYFTFTSYFDNIKISRNGTTQSTGYTNGNPGMKQLVISNKTVSHALSAIPYSGFPAPDYHVVTPKYPSSEDIPVVSFDVTSASFGAVGDGSTDDTYAFQKALYAAQAAGGGVVYAPSRKYAINGHLYIPAGVILRGDWASPDNGGLGVGTILQATENANNESGTPFITMANGSTAEYLSVWYPNQSYSSVTPYPWTFRFITYGGQMVRNVTMINSYDGIGSGNSSAGGSEINNVYGTILHKGIEIGNSWDVDRWENVKFIPDYWSNCGLAGAPAGSTNLQTLKNYMSANATGIIAKHIDGIFGYNIYLRSFNTGILFTNDATYTGGYSCGTLSNLDIDAGTIGIKVDYTSGWGIMISNSSIKASVGSTPYAVQITSNFSGNIDQYVGFNKCTIGGSPNTAVLMNGGGNAQASFQNCTFTDWGYSGGTYAINAQSGNIIVNDCSFRKNAGDIYLGASVSSASICGNTFYGSAQITNNSGKSSAYVFIDNTTNFDFNRINAAEHTYKVTLPKPPNSNFYNVKSAPYNAHGDSVTDDTSAIQNALTAAGNAGGGTVFLPAGDYKINGTLSVPSNVELRGVNEVLNVYTLNSRLSCYSGQGNASGTPAVTLAQNAGVRGVAFFYPNQDSNNISAYPWTIRGNGSGVYVIDTLLLNSYQGIDFGLTNACPAHYIRNVRGTVLSKGIYVGNNNSYGWVEECNFNIGYWLYSNTTNNPGDFASIDTYCLNNVTTMQLGYCANEQLLNNFSFAARTAYKFVNQTGGSCRGTFINTGSDGARTAMDIGYSEATDGIETIGLLCIVQDYSADNILINIPVTCTGKVRIYGITMSGGGLNQPIKGIYTFGANVGVQQCHFGDSASSYDYVLIDAEGGNARFENIQRAYNSSTDAYIGSGVTSVQIYGSKWTGSFDSNNQAGSKFSAIGNVIQ